MYMEAKVLQSIKKEIESMEGNLGFYYKNLVTGEEYGYNEGGAFLAASVIKLPLFLYILAESAAGRISLSERLVTENSHKVPSCGALNLFTGAVETDILTLCRLMICISDNTATNRLIKHFGIAAVNAGFAAMGLKKTKLRRLLFDSEASARGLENTVCPLEMGMLLEQLYRGTFINEDVSRLALDVLLQQQINHKLGGKLDDVDIAHKTGEDDMLSNDVGIIYANRPFVLCFTGNHTDVYRWETVIREAAYDLYHSQAVCQS